MWLAGPVGQWKETVRMGWACVMDCCLYFVCVTLAQQVCVGVLRLFRNMRRGRCGS